MIQNCIIPILIYFLLLICQNANTTAVSPQENFKTKEISLNKCQNCNQLEAKIKREIDNMFSKETKSKYVKKLSESFYKYQKNLNKYKYLLLKSWGARGMPFNVLYTPNIHQQKIMKSIPSKQEKAKIIKGPSQQVPEIYDLVLEYEKPTPKLTESILKKHTKPRKYYSLIPQLFVSYGW